MTILSATGYYNGQSYTLNADDDLTANPLDGIIVSGHPDVIAMLISRTGQDAQMEPMGDNVPVGVDTIQGLMAGLATYTEAAQFISPDGLPTDLPDTDGTASYEVDY